MTHEIRLKKAPSLLSLYTRALLKQSKASTPPSTLPTLALTLRVNKDKLKHYNLTCGINTQASTLPIFYPQVLAFKLHLECLLDKQLPFPVMGLVHRSNKVEYTRPIFSRDVLEIKVNVSDYNEMNKGINCTVLTRVFVKGELRWQAESTYFYRKTTPITQTNKASKKPDIIAVHSEAISWSLPANLGRQYAWITGDLNPIHLFNLSARLFGFKRTIIHGMCMAAKAAAQAQSDEEHYPIEMKIVFNKPIYLPSKVGFVQSSEGFAIHPTQNHHLMTNPMLTGKLKTSINTQAAKAL